MKAAHSINTVAQRHPSKTVLFVVVVVFSGEDEEK